MRKPRSRGARSPRLGGRGALRRASAASRPAARRAESEAPRSDRIGRPRLRLGGADRVRGDRDSAVRSRSLPPLEARAAADSRGAAAAGAGRDAEDRRARQRRDIARDGAGRARASAARRAAARALRAARPSRAAVDLASAPSRSRRRPRPSRPARSIASATASGSSAAARRSAPRARVRARPAETEAGLRIPVDESVSLEGGVRVDSREEPGREAAAVAQDAAASASKCGSDQSSGGEFDHGAVERLGGLHHHEVGAVGERDEPRVGDLVGELAVELRAA